MRLRKLLLVATASFAAVATSAQVRLVQNHQPQSRLIVTTSEAADSTAAVLLQDFVRRSTQATLPIVSHREVHKLKKNDVLIGNGLSNAAYVTPQLREDGYLLSTDDGHLRIVSGGDGGSVYGVAELLERYLGVYYWTAGEYSLQQLADVTIPRIRQVDNPAFMHRQTLFYGLTDPLYKLFSRYEWVDELFAGNYWVHTFNRLLPAEQYAAAHPEYYAFYDGARQARHGSQWCMTNPEVLEIVAQRIDSIFKAHPDRHMISVSQNDGNFAWCVCDSCRALAEREGSLSGPYIHFMNQLADRFPDKEISTLSYQFSRYPPKHVKPRPNVNIFLCNIECTREVPFFENETGRDFQQALQGWNEISDNIFVWDYGINFDNYIAPFPNFHILRDNIQMCRDNDVKRYFLQCSPIKGTDFAEMRAWVASKLMWNPEADTDSLMQVFLKGYYGEGAAPYLYHYHKLMEGSLLASQYPLRIYDTPASHKNGMLNPRLMRRYTTLFDQAEAAVAADSVCLARVQRARLPLLYAELEILRDNPPVEGVDVAGKLQHFDEACRRFDVKTLNEKGNLVAEYVQQYKDRFLHRDGNLARGAQVTYQIPPHARYAAEAPTALTDGVFGSYQFRNSWLGWEGTDGSFTLDLGEAQTFTTIETDFLLQAYQWIFLPEQVRYSFSADGEHFDEAASLDVPEDNSSDTKFIGVSHTWDIPQKARYIRVDVVGKKFIPAGPCWFFIDEVTVR